MEIVDKLSRELLEQDFSQDGAGSLLERYRSLAASYAELENALAVLSDMRSDSSYIYYGGFARTLGLSGDGDGSRTGSIWEQEILARIHPDDLRRKMLGELSFFRLMSRIPQDRRSRYYLAGAFRFRDASGNHVAALHRMFYISLPGQRGIQFALCLYNPLNFEMKPGCIVVDSYTGRTRTLDAGDSSGLLSAREKEVLLLIDKGLTSKHIATMLSISVNTVSRHRQKILAKLKVNNSIEACRLARELGLL